jgi:hypothetical protein
MQVDPKIKSNLTYTTLLLHTFYIGNCTTWHLVAITTFTTSIRGHYITFFKTSFWQQFFLSPMM